MSGDYQFDNLPAKRAGVKPKIVSKQNCAGCPTAASPPLLAGSLPNSKPETGANRLKQRKNSRDLTSFAVL